MLDVPEMPEVLRRVLLCMLEAVEGRLCLLKVLEVVRCMLLCMLQDLESGLSFGVFEISIVAATLKIFTPSNYRKPLPPNERVHPHGD